MNSELHYVVRQPKKQLEQPPLLILLHGYGSNELDLFSFADELPDELLIVSARAPYDMSFGGHAWYAINLDGNNEKFSDLDEARVSLTKIATFIDCIVIFTKKKELQEPCFDKSFVEAGVGLFNSALAASTASARFNRRTIIASKDSSRTC